MQLEVGMILEGRVTGITKYGAFVDLSGGKTGMVHISEVASKFVEEIRDHISEGDTVKVKVLNIGDDGKISLSIKKALDHSTRTDIKSFDKDKSVKRPGSFEWKNKKSDSSQNSFEDMMSKFKQASEEKISDLKKINETKRGGYSRRGSGQHK